MKRYTLDDICSFAARTGDTVIVLRDGEALVVQNLHDYKKMIEHTDDISSLSEEAFLERINREIAKWKAAQDSEAVDTMEDYDILPSLASRAADSANFRENREVVEPLTPDA